MKIIFIFFLAFGFHTSFCQSYLSWAKGYKYKYSAFFSNKTIGGFVFLGTAINPNSKSVAWILKLDPYLKRLGHNSAFKEINSYILLL